MKLSEYLKLRPSYPAYALTNHEARLIGIDMRHGWVDRCADMDVPDELVEAMKNGDFLKLFVRKGKTAKKYAHVIPKSVLAELD